MPGLPLSEKPLRQWNLHRKEPVSYTHLKLWYVLAGLSAVGIAVTSVVAYKKKKKEGNE